MPRTLLLAVFPHRKSLTCSFSTGMTVLIFFLTQNSPFHTKQQASFRSPSLTTMAPLLTQKDFKLPSSSDFLSFVFDQLLKKCMFLRKESRSSMILFSFLAKHLQKSARLTVMKWQVVIVTSRAFRLPSFSSARAFSPKDSPSPYVWTQFMT